MTEAPTILVDSNVLIDVLTDDPTWSAWSLDALERAADASALAINPVIYAEVSIPYDRIEDLDDALPLDFFRRLPMPDAAAFLAGKAFLRYRRSSGAQRSPLPDFFIGAHAAVGDMSLLTRDASRYAKYYPTVPLIAP